MEYIDAYARNPERQVPNIRRYAHLLKLFVFRMEKAGGVARTDLALSALRAVGILSQVFQLLGGKMVSTRYDEVVLEIEGFLLAIDE
jgi:hypothetical protein